MVESRVRIKGSGSNPLSQSTFVKDAVIDVLFPDKEFSPQKLKSGRAKIYQTQAELELISRFRTVSVDARDYLAIYRSAVSMYRDPKYRGDLIEYDAYKDVFLQGKNVVVTHFYPPAMYIQKVEDYFENCAENLLIGNIHMFTKMLMSTYCVLQLNTEIGEVKKVKIPVYSSDQIRELDLINYDLRYMNGSEVECLGDYHLDPMVEVSYRGEKMLMRKDWLY